MNLDYFRKINNTYNSSSKQDTELFLINRNEDMFLYDNIDKKDVLKNGEPYELIVEKGTSDHNKKIKSKHNNPFNLGDYISYNGMVYLVTSLDPDDKTHHNGAMTLCMHMLRWQKYDGTIVKRWATTSDFTKYDSGQTANGVITIPSNQYGLIVPIDSETKLINRDTRFVMDILTEDDVKHGAVPDTYILSNEKPVLNDYTYFGRGGTITFTTKFDSFNAETDKWVDCGDGDYGWICDYIEPQLVKTCNVNDTTNVKATIIGSESIKDRKRTWKVEFTNDNGDAVDFNKFKWNILQDEDFIYIEDGGHNDNYITLKTSRDYIGNIFELQILDVKDNILSSIEIEVIG